MVTIRIPLNIGELDENKVQKEIKYRQVGSLPLSFGLQKAFARYAALQAKIFEDAQITDALPPADSDDIDRANKYEHLVDDVKKLSEEKTALLLRAFGNQITIDDLDMASADDVDIAFARLQIEAGGIVRKNS